ncbi:MAG: hypothetical protein IJT12_03945 [Paludibacteraceae bacterium]|nr:hypothetical protein [Paludibacteraceae bacterium]
MKTKKIAITVLACLAISIVCLGFFESRRKAGLPYSNLSELLQDSTMNEFLRNQASNNATMEVQWVTCPTCNGNKVVVVGYNYNEPIWDICANCRGTGVVGMPVVNSSPTFKTNLVRLYDEEGTLFASNCLYYPSIEKIHINGGTYHVVTSNKHGFNRQVRGYRLYFKY